MKKTVLFFMLIAGIVMSLSSCLLLFSKTHKMVVDPDVSADQTVLVTFINDTGNGWFSLKQWNNNDIKEGLYRNKGTSSNDKAKLTVPAGNNSFTFDLYYTFSTQSSSTTYTFKDIELRYDLELGKEYVVKGKTKSLGFLKGSEFYVGIYEKQGNKLLKEWKIGN